MSFPADADVETVSDKLYAAGLTDGLPVVPPTSSRVRSMIGERHADANLGILGLSSREITVRHLATCAVMSGCKPEHFSVLVAAIKAVQDSSFNLLGVLTTTGSAAVGCIIHGRCVEELDANAYGNCLGPGNRANAAIGRGLTLSLRNLGGAVPGTIDMATMGQPAKYSFCFAENQAATPWATLAAERGIGEDESAVTVFAAVGTAEVADIKSESTEGLLTTLAGSMTIAGNLSSGGDMLGGGETVVLLPPEWTGRMAHEGWTKQQIREYVFDKASLPLDKLSSGVRATVAGSVKEKGLLRVARNPSDVVLVVTGGVGSKATFVPTWGGGTRSVTARVYSD